MVSASFYIQLIRQKIQKKVGECDLSFISWQFSELYLGVNSLFVWATLSTAKLLWEGTYRQNWRGSAPKPKKNYKSTTKSLAKKKNIKAQQNL